VPALVRFLVVLTILAGLGFEAMFGLATLIQPDVREITIPTPPDRLPVPGAEAQGDEPEFQFRRNIGPSRSFVGAHQNEGAMLAGDRVLVVEDEPLVAEGLRDLFAEAEEMPVGLASSVSSGRSLRPRALVRSEGD
jgi:hypothetical protein